MSINSCNDGFRELTEEERKELNLQTKGDVKISVNPDGRRTFWIDVKDPVDSEAFIKRLKEEFAKRKNTTTE